MYLMNFHEYEDTGFNKYQSFSETVKSILEKTIPSELHLQQIQCRAKDHNSLEKKLIDKGLQNPNNIENDIKDLAGCRIIFYYNSDVGRFINSPTISDNFKVDWEKSKIHYPTGENITINTLYNAYHYIVELNENMSNLPKFEEYKGLKCEIQIHTILNHAWSETAHNITYKKPEEISNFGNIYKQIENRLKEVMEKYITPAGYEFEKIQYDYEQLLQGKDIIQKFNSNNIDKIENRNDLYDLLDHYNQYVLQNDNVNKEIDFIFHILISIIEKSKNLKIVSIKTPFGQLDGKTHNDIIKKCSEIIIKLRYVDIKKTFKTALTIFNITEAKEGKKEIVLIIKKLTEYNLDIVKNYRFNLQEKILFYITNWEDSQLTYYQDIIFTVCEEIFKTIIDTTTSNFKTVTWAKTNLPGSKQLAKIREKAIDLLDLLLQKAQGQEEKRIILAVSQTATKTSISGKDDNVLLEIIMNNTLRIISIIKKSIFSIEFELLEKIENDLYFFYKRSKQIVDDKKEEKQVILISKKIMLNIEKLVNEINSKNDYVIYKTLVGFNSVFPDELSVYWEYEVKKQFRNNQICSFINNVTRDTYSDWDKIIIKCAKTDSCDLATFLFFQIFLEKLMVEKPKYGKRLIELDNIYINKFLVSIIGGLLKSTEQKFIGQKISCWIDKGLHLYKIARAYEFFDQLNLENLEKIFLKAKKQKDYDVIIQIISTLVEKSDILYQNLIIKCICVLASISDSRWIKEIRDIRKLLYFIGSLDYKKINLVLVSMLPKDKIEYNDKLILKRVAKKYSNLVINFLLKRIKNKKENFLTTSYEAIPDDLNILAEPFNTQIDSLLNQLTKLYEKNSELFRFRGANLIKSIFPQINDNLKKELISKIKSNNKKNLEIVIALLNNYRDDSSLYDICKKIINLKGESVFTKISIILENTGMITGEYGTVSLYERKIKEIKDWLKDSNKNINSFAKKYIADLETKIKFEKCRTDQEIEINKHIYGS